MQTKRGSRVATSLLLFCSSMMRRHRSRHVLRRLTSAQLVLSTTAIRSPLPPRAPRMIVTDSALNGSGGLSGWLALPADCLPVASQAVRGALLGYVAHSRVCCTGRTTPTATTSSRWRRGRRTSMTSPKDLPEICGRRLTGGRTAFKASSPTGEGLVTHAEIAFLECWGSLARRPPAEDCSAGSAAG